MTNLKTLTDAETDAMIEKAKGLGKVIDMEAKKVFVVTSGCYSDYQIDAIFTDEAEAERVAKTISDGEVETWLLNVGVDKLAQGLTLYRVEMDKQGEVVTFEKRTDTYDDAYIETKYDIRGSFSWSVCDRKPTRLHLTCWARDKAHAIKITSEHLAMTLARGDWRGVK